MPLARIATNAHQPTCASLIDACRPPVPSHADATPTPGKPGAHLARLDVLARRP
jgi:hypothetical protein